LSIDRRNALRDRAVHTVSVPIPEPQTNSQGWQWMTDAPQADADNLTWIIDGSRRYAADWTLSTTGFGVAVVDQEETLLAYAYATPPSWVKTASAAEAWALLLTLNSQPGGTTYHHRLSRPCQHGPRWASSSHRSLQDGRQDMERNQRHTWR
jgi:hypothetical protein